MQQAHQQASEAALEIRRLSKEYRRRVPVLRDVDLRVSATGITAIIGPSGTGKSVLLKTYWTVSDAQIEASVVLANPPLENV